MDVRDRERVNLNTQQSLRQRQKAEELCAAALRALTGDAQLHYRGWRLYQGMQHVPAPAPHLRMEPEEERFSTCRAVTDAMAQRLLFSDAGLHHRLAPEEPVERLVFGLLEQLRVETLVPEGMPGMRANLQEHFENWSRAFCLSGLAEGEIALLLYSVMQIGWSRLNTRPVLEDSEDLIESTRFALVPLIGNALDGLRRNRHLQEEFARHALEISRLIAEMIRRANDETPQGKRSSLKAEALMRRFSLMLDLDRDERADSIAAATTGESKVFEESGQAYRAFTTRYDAELPAGDLVRKAVLREYRERLDQRVAAQGINIRRLARLFSNLLALPQTGKVIFGEEEGRIDGRRLSQLVSSPAERRLFYQEQVRPGMDCLVTFLVDCSGSMKEHVEAVATLVDVLLRALEMAGVRTELLGFTTGAWHGGRAYRDWLNEGRPAYPGRLNEVRHLVFKDAERSWQRSRAGIAALFKTDLFREGIDGEAVEWACQRMHSRSEARRILLVISDGCPADGATSLANDAFYLDKHLKDVVARHEQQGLVEINGLGVGLDLSPFYRHCLAADMAQGFSNELFFDVVRLLAKPPAKGRMAPGNV